MLQDPFFKAVGPRTLWTICLYARLLCWSFGLKYLLEGCLKSRTLSVTRQEELAES